MGHVCSDWAHALRITFTNTADPPSRAQSLLPNFPALVRLSKENFPFAAGDVPADIRFVDDDGTDLAYEIEDWNASSRQAAIWVRLPHLDPCTPDATDERNPVVMYWGRPGAISLSAGPAVFSAFTTVLHLTPTSDRQAVDSSGHGNDGDNSSDLPGAWVPGQAGQALDINVQETLATPTALPAPTEFTLSIWFKTTAKRGGGLIGFADTQGFSEAQGLSETKLGPAPVKDRVLWMADRRLHFAVLNTDGVYSVVSSSPLNQFDVGYSDGRWHMAAARLSSEGQALFVDGELVGASATTPVPVPCTGYWRFGTSNVDDWPAESGIPAAASDQFPGIIDEIRISPTPLSDGRIAADYQIQREDTRWVKTERLDVP